MKTLWLHHESGCGGRLEEEPGNDDFAMGDANLVEYHVRMEVYIHWMRQGYEVDWVPPEWVLALFD